jgi:predicted ATPase
MLLERERELTVIGDALAEAQEGRGQVVLVEAAAGLGKTSLLRAACEAATATGFACLRARASELEHDFAYGCVRQLLEAVVANAAEPERHRLFDGAATLSEPLFSPAAAPPSSSADTSFSVLHGLYWLLNNLAAEGALALSLDDLHWADPASLRLTSYLAPRLDGLRVVVFASVRPDEGDTLELARLAAAPETAVIRPGPLSGEATAALCERTLGVAVAPEFAAACREATGGNPFFLEALLREASDEGLATDWPTWSSSASARSCWEAQTRSPRAGARTPLWRTPPWATGSRPAGWRPRIWSGRGAGEPRAGSESRCALSPW